MSASPVAIEVCATWSLGVHPIAQIGDTMHHVVVMVALNKRTQKPMFPAMFDPGGDIERGDLVVVCGVTCERFGGASFCRAWLDLVRAAWPGVRWVTGKPLGYARLTAAYGCLNGRVVGIIANVLGHGGAT